MKISITSLVSTPYEKSYHVLIANLDRFWQFYKNSVNDFQQNEEFGGTSLSDKRTNAS